MKRLVFYIMIGTLFFSCNGQVNNKAISANISIDTSKYKWIKLTDSTAFPKAYNFQMFSVRDTVWALHHAGTWFSTDAKNWKKSPLKNIIKNNGFLDYVWFKNALYCLGTFDGNIEHYTLTTQVAKTIDFKTWKILAANSNLPKRFFYHPFVFKNKIWIVGGTDGKNIYNDAWTSEDAVHWIKVADNLPFGKKESWNGAQFIIFKNILFRLDNDAWSSQDGINWNKLTDRIADESTFGYSPIVYDNKIWLIGCNRNGKFLSEVIYSENGKVWKPEKAPWSPRGGATTCVFKNKLLMTGGKYGGLLQDGKTTEFIYSNDVWTMAKK